MATPYVITRPNGVTFKSGQYFGSDSEAYAMFMLYRKTKPFNWMTSRAGGFQWFNQDIRRTHVATGTWDYVNESEAYKLTTLRELGSTTATAFEGTQVLIPPTNNTVNCVRNKVKNAKINLPVFTAEANKAASLIGGHAARLANAALAIKRGQFGKAANTLGMSKPNVPSKHKRGLPGLADNWLSYRYGWLPLLMDVDGAVQALTLPAMEGVLGIARCRRPFSYSKRFNGVGYTMNVDGFGSVTAGVYYLCKNGADFNNLGLSNPLEVAWELVPFSFVVDWFIPIGKAFSAIDAFENVTVLASYVNSKYTEKVSARYNVLRSDKVYHYNGVANRQRNGCFRSVDLNGGSVVTTALPTVNLNLNITKMLDAIGLLQGAFGRR